MAIILIKLCFLNFMLGLSGVFDTRCFVPIFNVVVKGVLKIGIVKLGACCTKLHERRRLCCFLLKGNTAHGRTVTPFIHRTLVGTFDPNVTGVTMAKLITLPKAVVKRVLKKDSPRITVGCRVVVMIVAIITSVLSLVVAVFLTSQGSFSDCNQLLQIRGSAGQG